MTFLSIFHTISPPLALLAALAAATACSKAASKLASDAQIEGAAFAFLRFSVVSGTGQTVSPKQPLPEPLVFRITDDLGQSMPGVLVKTCLIDVTGYEDGAMVSADLVSACQGEQVKLANTKPIDGTNDSNVPSLGKLGPQDFVGQVIDGNARSDRQGLINVNISAPNFFDRRIAVMVMVDAKIAASPMAFATYQTSPFGVAEKFALERSDGGDLIAGSNFDLFITVRDREGFQVRTYDGKSDFTLKYDLPNSWAGQAAVLPNKRFTCVFTGGRCLIPGGPFNLMAAGKAVITMQDHGHADIASSIDINVIKGPEAAVVVADNVGGDAAGAMPLTKVTLAQTEKYRVAAAVVDRGGNYLRDGTDYAWSMSNADLTDSLPKGSTESFVFVSKASGTGQLTAKGALGVSAPVTVEVLPGPHATWVITTEHGANEGAGECFALTIVAADENGNTSTSVEGAWLLDLSFGGVTESGPPVKDKAHWTSNDGVFGNHTIISSVFTAGVSTLPVRACLYDASNVAPTILVSSPAKTNPSVTITGELDINVHLSAPDAIDLSTGPFGDPDATSPCAGRLGDDPNDPCIDFTVDEANNRLYVLIVDKGGNPLLSGTPSYWMADGPLAPALNGKEIVDFVPLKTTTVGTGTVQVSAGAGFRLKKPYRVRPGAPASFVVSSENGNEEVATKPFAVRLQAYDQFGNFADTYNGSRLFGFTLQGSATSPAPAKVAPVVTLDETVAFTNGAGLTTGTLLQPRATNQPGLPPVNPIIQASSQGQQFASDPIFVAPGKPETAALYSLPGGLGNAITAPIGIRRDTTLVANVVSLDANSNFVRDEPATFTANVVCTTAGKGCPYDPLSAHSGISTTLVPNQTGTGTLTATPTDGSIAPFTLSPISINASSAESYRISTTNNLKEPAGKPFQITVSARDHDGNVATSYAGEKTLNFVATTNPSWTGLASILPNGNVVCTFTAGVCVLSDADGPIEFVVNDARQVHLLSVTDVGNEIPDIWGSSITALKGAPAQVLITTAPGNTGATAPVYTASQLPEALAWKLPPEYTATADDDPFDLYGVFVDEGGNYIDDVPASATWSGASAAIDSSLSRKSGKSTRFIPGQAGSGNIAVSASGMSGSTRLITVYHGVPTSMDLDTEHHRQEVAGVPFDFSFTIYDRARNRMSDLTALVKVLEYEWIDSFVGLPAFGPGDWVCPTGCSHKENSGQTTIDVSPYITINQGQYSGTSLKARLFDAAANEAKLKLTIGSCVSSAEDCLTGVIDKEKYLAQIFPHGRITTFTLTSTQAVSLSRGTVSRVRFYKSPSDLTSEACDSSLTAPTFDALANFPTTLSKALVHRITPMDEKKKIRVPLCMELVSGKSPAKLYPRYSDAGGNDFGPTFGNWEVQPRTLTSVTVKVSEGLSMVDRRFDDQTGLTASDLAAIATDVTEASSSSHAVITPRRGTMARFSTVEYDYKAEPVILKFTDLGAHHIDAMLAYTVGAGVPTGFRAGVAGPAIATNPIQLGIWLEDAHQNLGHVDDLYPSGADRSGPIPLTFALSTAWHDGIVPPSTSNGKHPQLATSSSVCSFLAGTLVAHPSGAGDCLSKIPLIPVAQTPTDVDVTLAGLGTQTVTITTVPGSLKGVQVLTDTAIGAPPFSPNLTFTSDETVRFYGGSWDDNNNYAGPVALTAEATGIIANMISPTGPASTIILSAGSPVGTGTLKFYRPPNISIDLGTVTITPGAPDHFVLRTEHNGSETAGHAFNLTIEARDKAGNLCTQITEDIDINWLITGDAATAERRSNILPSDGIVHFEAGVSTTALSAVLFNSLKAPTITVSTRPGASGISGQAKAITVNPDEPHHYGVMVTSGTNYVPKADLSTTMAVVVEMRDAWGNRVSGGETGVELTMVNASDGSPAIGSLAGSVTDLDLTSGQVAISNVAWGRPGRYQIRARKPSGGAYDTPVGPTSEATDTINSLVTLAAIKGYKLTIAAAAAAGQPQGVQISALDVSDQIIADSAVGTLLAPLTFTWSGASTAPDGTAPVFPAHPTFVQGTASLESITFQKAETIPAGSLVISDSQATPVTGATTNVITVSPGPIDHYKITSNYASRLADDTATGQFALTITCYDSRGNPRNGDTVLSLIPERVNGPATVSTINKIGSAIGSNPTFNMAATSSVTLSNLYYLVPQTVSFTLTGASGSAGIISDHVSFVVSSATVKSYSLSLSNIGSVVAGNDNVTATVTALDIAGNAVIDLDSALDTLNFDWTGTAIAASPDPAAVAPVLPSTLTFTNGVATASLSLFSSRSGTVTVKDNYPSGERTSSPSMVTVLPAATAKLVMSVAGSTNGVPNSTAAVAGVPFDIQVDAHDAYDNLVDTAQPPTGTLTFAWVNASGSLSSSVSPTVLASGNRAFGGAGNHPGVFLSSDVAAGAFALYNASDSGVLLRLASSPWPADDLAFTVSPNPSPGILKIHSSASKSSTVVSGTTISVTSDAAPTSYYAHSYDAWGNYLQREKADWSGSGALDVGNCNNCNISPTTGVDLTTVTPGSTGTGVLTATLSGTSSPSTSLTLSVTPGAPKSLQVSASATSVTAGQAVGLAVTILDKNGNVCTQINTGRSLYWAISDGASNTEGRSADLDGSAFPTSGTYSFAAGVMTSTVTARLYNALANAPLITASMGPNGTNAAGSTGAFTIAPGAPDHYGIAVNGVASYGSTPYSPRADYGTSLTAVIQLRDSHGNRLDSGGESGVDLSMYDVSNSTTATGTLQGTITGLDLTSGQATISNLAWPRGGVYQLRAAKSSGGAYSTPVGVGTVASTTITSTATLATVASYGIAYSTPMTAGTGSPVTVYALDTAGVAVTGIDTQLTALQFTWNGPHSAPNGQTPVYPTSLTFSGGVAISFWTLYNAETIATSSLSMHDSQTSPVSGAPVLGSSALVVAPSNTIDHYGVTSLVSSLAADSSGTFELTVTCYDPYSNPRKGENGIYLDYARVSGAATLGLLSYGATLYQASTQALGLSQFPLNMAAVSSTTIGPFTFTSPQTIQFSITMSSVASSTTVSQQIAFSPTAGTIYSYALGSPSQVAAGPSNVMVTVSAQDRVGNTLTTLDSVLNSRTYTWYYTTSPANPLCTASTFTATDKTPDGTHDFGFGATGAFSSGVATMTASVYKTGTKGFCVKDNASPQISGGSSVTVTSTTDTHFVMTLGTYTGSTFTPLASGTSGGLASYTLTAGTEYAVVIEARDMYENQNIAYNGSVNNGSANVLQWVGTTSSPDASSPYTLALGATAGAPTMPSNSSCFYNSSSGCPSNGVGQGMALVDGLYLYNAVDSSVRLRLSNPDLATADLAITVVADPSQSQTGIKTLVQAGSTYTSTAYPAVYPSVAADVANFNLFAHQYDRFGNWIGQQTVDWSGSGRLAGIDSNNSPIVNPTAGTNFTTINLYQSGSGTLTVKSPGTSTVLATLSFTITGGAPVKYAVALASGSSVTANGSFSITVTAQDSKGNPAGSYTPSGNLSYTILSASSTAAQPTACSNVTPAASTPTFTNSVATVGGFKLVNTSDTNVKIRVSGDLTSGTSAVIPINPGTSTGLWLAVDGGGSVTAGPTGFDSTISIVDGCSNRVTSHATPASFNFALSGAGSSLENTTAPSVPANGSVTIPASTGFVSTSGGAFKVYKRTGTNYDGTVTLSASCSVVSGCPASYTSNAVTLTVNPGSLHHMYLQSSAANYRLPSTKLTGTLSSLAANSGAAVTYYAWGYDFYGNAISTITSPAITWATGGVTNAALSAASGASTTLMPGTYAGGSPASLGSETITATCSSCTPTSITLTQPIVAGTAAKFTVTAPSTVTANASFSATVQATDFFANPVTTYSGSKSLTLTLPGNTGATPAAPTSCSVVIPSGAVTFPAAGSNSVVTISGFKVPRNGDNFTVTVAATSMVSSSSSTVTVNSAGTAATLRMTIGGSASAYTATAGTGFDVTVNAVDACSNLQTAGGGTLKFTLSGAGTSFENAAAPVKPADGAVALASGTVTTTGGQFTLYKRTGTSYDGTVTLQALCASCAYTASNAVTLTVNPGALHHFYLQSSGAAYPLPGVALSGTLATLTANTTVTYYAWSYDLYGNALNAQPTASWSTGAVTNAAKSTASGTSMMLTPGAYSVSPPSLGNETITASVAGATPSSVTVTQPITYGPLSSFGLTPSGGTSVTAGTGFDITATARDVKGNTVASTASYALTWSWMGTNTTSPAPSSTAPTLDTNTTRTFTNGVYTSTGAPFKIYSANASGAYVKVTSGTPQGQTSTFTVSPANAVSLSVTATPTPTAGVASSGYTVKALDTWSNPSTAGCGTTSMTATCAACTSSGLYGGTATSPVYTGSPWNPTSGVYTPNITLYKAGTNTLTFSACGLSVNATPTVNSTAVSSIYLATGTSDPGQPASGASATSVACTSGNNVTCQNVYAYAFDAYGNSISQGTWSCPSWTAVNADAAPFTTAAYVPSLSAASGHSVTTSASYAYHMNDYIKCTSGAVSAQALAGPTVVTNRPYTIGAYSSWSCSVGNPVSTATLTNSSGYNLSGVTFSGQNAGNTVSGCSSTVTGVGSSGTCTITVTGTPGTSSGTISPTGTITTANSQNLFATLSNPAGAMVQANAAAPNCSSYLSIASSGWSCFSPGHARMTLTVTNPNGLNSAAGVTNAFVTQAGATQISTTCSSVTLNTNSSNSCSFVIDQTTPGNVTSVKAHATTAYFSSTDATYTTDAAPTCP
jgi:hypothetical protein